MIGRTLLATFVSTAFGAFVSCSGTAVAEEEGPPAVHAGARDLAAFYKSLKGSPLGALYKNAQVKEFLAHYLKPLGITLTGARNKAATDALDRLLSGASGPAELLVPQADSKKGMLPGFAASVGAAKPAQALKEIQTLMKSAPAGTLDEKSSKADGKKTLTYTVKPPQKGRPQVRFPFEKLSFVESKNGLVITNLDHPKALALLSGDIDAAGKGDAIEIAFAAGALRSLLKPFADYVPGGPAVVNVRSEASGLVAVARFIGADIGQSPFRYLGGHPATLPQPGIADAYAEMAARLNLAGAWDTFWAELKRRSAAEHFAARATLLEIEKNMGVRVAEELIPALEGSVVAYRAGAEGRLVLVLRVAREATVKKAVEALAAFGGKPGAGESGTYEIRMAGGERTPGSDAGTWYARVAGGFLVLSAHEGVVKAFPGSSALTTSSGPVAMSADVPKAYAAEHSAQKNRSIVDKQRGPVLFPPSLLAGKLGKVTVRSSRDGDDFVLDAELKYARGK
ncbi:MAG: hypothetical protein HY897_22170 [Deltaproteobacteria bacterium]|nr:hypothetical protein [Deltaproteobacteria bacterium]